MKSGGLTQPPYKVYPLLNLPIALHYRTFRKENVRIVIRVLRERRRHNEVCKDLF